MRLDVVLEHALSPLTLPIFGIVVILSAAGSSHFFNDLVMITVPGAVYCVGYVLVSRISKNENVYFSLPCVPALASFAAVYYAYGPVPILLLSATSLFVFFSVVYILRTYWRISMHMMFYVGVSAILSIMDSAFLAMFLLTPAVAWCRLSLRRHTPAQLAGGFAVGLAAPVLIGLFTGLV